MRATPQIWIVLGVTAALLGCGSQGGGGSTSGGTPPIVDSGAPAPTPTPEPDPTPAPIPPSGDQVMLADFENGQVAPEFNFFVNNQYNAGQYTWSVDSTQGAAGTRKSLKFHVTHGAPYFYYDPFHLAKTGYLAQGKDVNRLGFYLKLPAGWGQSKNPYYNMHIGWYLSNRPSENETNNGHFYHYLYLVPGTDWIHVVVGANYAWERDQSSPSFDPGHTFHLLDFPSFFPKVTRFYITGAPNPGNFEFASVPYDMWIDEIEMFHQDDALKVDKPVVKSGVGSATTITLTNMATSEATYDVKVTNLNGKGVTVKDESGAAATSLAFGPGRQRVITVAPNGTGTSNVVFYPHGVAQNPNVQNRSANTGYRGSYDRPGAAVLVVGQ